MDLTTPRCWWISACHMSYWSQLDGVVRYPRLAPTWRSDLLAVCIHSRMGLRIVSIPVPMCQYISTWLNQFEDRRSMNARDDVTLKYLYVARPRDESSQLVPNVREPARIDGKPLRGCVNFRRVRRPNSKQHSFLSFTRLACSFLTITFPMQKRQEHYNRITVHFKCLSSLV